jgi:hypothetical protein
MRAAEGESGRVRVARGHVGCLELEKFFPPRLMRLHFVRHLIRTSFVCDRTAEWSS